MFKIFTFIVCGLVALIGAYFVVIASSSNFFNTPSSIGMDEIFLYHALAIFSLVWLVIAMIKKVISRAILLGFIGALAVFEGGFTMANIQGDLWDLSEQQSLNLVDYIGQMIE